jgi:hypothetical protein
MGKLNPFLLVAAFGGLVVAASIVLAALGVKEGWRRPQTIAFIVLFSVGVPFAVAAQVQRAGYHGFRPMGEFTLVAAIALGAPLLASHLVFRALGTLRAGLRAGAAILAGLLSTLPALSLAMLVACVMNRDSCI